MKVALITDIHFEIGDGNPVHANTIQNFFKFFFDELEKRQLKRVLCLGDFCDNRKRIQYSTIQDVKRIFVEPIEAMGIDTDIIVGNHDCSYRTNNNTSSASFLSEYSSKIRVHVNDPIDVKFSDGSIVGMIPWISPHNSNSVEEYLKNTTTKLICGHFSIVGAKMHGNTLCTSGLNTSLFSKFERVYSGHFHSRSELDNITYIGNIAHFNWGDYGEPRGFCILDTLTGELEYVDNPYTPFLKFVYNDKEWDNTKINDFCEDYTNKIIKIIVAEKTNHVLFETIVSKISETASSVTVVDCDSVEYTSSEDDKTSVAVKTDTLDIIDDCLDSLIVSDNILAQVKTTLKELYVEASAKGAF